MGREEKEWKGVGEKNGRGEFTAFNKPPESGPLSQG